MRPDTLTNRRDLLKGSFIAIPVPLAGSTGLRPLLPCPGISEVEAECEEVYGTCNVKVLGAIGDGRSHPLGQRYRTLDEAHRAYPVAESLEDEIDWAAIQTALRKCDVVFLPPGRYILGEQTLSLNGRKHLVGAGMSIVTLLYTGNDAAVWINSNGKSETSFWRLHNLTIDCTAMGAYGMRLGQWADGFKSANHGILDSIMLTRAREAGLHLVSSQINIFLNVHCHSNLGDGCRVHAREQNTDSHFYGCAFRYNGRHGLWANNGSVFSFHGCTFELNRGEGVRLIRTRFVEGEKLDSGTRNDTPTRNWVYERCYFEANNQEPVGEEPFAHFHIDSEQRSIWQHVELYRCFFASQTVPGSAPEGAHLWNIVAGRCQLCVWYPDVAYGPVGTDTGSSAAFITIWDDKGPLCADKIRVGGGPDGGGWVLGGPESPVIFRLVNGADCVRPEGTDDVTPAVEAIYFNDGGTWRSAINLSRNGILKSEMDVEITHPRRGLILTSPRGFRYRVTVDDTGSLVSTAV